MRILFLCNKSPYPPIEGGPIAMNALIEGVASEGHEVKVLAVSSFKFPVELHKVPSHYLLKTGLETVEFDLKIRPLGMMIQLLKGESYHLTRFYSKDFEEKLIRILSENTFDIVQLETLYMCPYIQTIRKYSDAKIVLRAHNIEHLIWRQLSLESNNPFKRMVLRQLARSLEKYENAIPSLVDGIAVISQSDLGFFHQFQNKTKVRLIPFGVQISPQDEALFHKDLSIFHIGSMNWIPNQNGIRWFLEEVWPEVHKNYPQIKAYFAGRCMPDWLLQCKQEGVTIIGEVKHAAEFIQQHDIMIVPLFSASGIRIKIIEAMLAGKTVISTSLGASGISYKNRENILIANDAPSFINAIGYCLENPQSVHEIGRKARLLVENEHNNIHVVRHLSGFYTELKQQSS